MNTPAPRVLVIRNDPTDPIGSFGTWLRAAGVDLVELCADLGDPMPTTVPRGIDGIVALGGGQSATDDHVAPWQPAERELLADAVNRAVPLLGVCLGAQLMTVALGGKVRPSRRPEVGLTPLNLTTEAAGDALFGALAQGVLAPQYHGDEMIALPPGAVLLASSERCQHQGWRLGEHAWAVQFHPEADAAVLASWCADDPSVGARWGVDPDAVVRVALEYAGELSAMWARFAAEFAGVVRERSRSLREART